MHIVYVATDVFGSKLNYELEFPMQPTVAEMIRQIETVFTQEQMMRNPGTTPYKVAKLNVVDEVTEDWVEVLTQSQLRNYCQVYSFQPHSTQLTESQGHIPAAVKPRHLQGAGVAMAASPTPLPLQPVTPIHNYTSTASIAALQQPVAPVSLPVHHSTPGVAQVRLLPQDASHDEKVRACFEGLDANANRVLELDEMKRGFQMFGMDFTQTTVDDLFRKGDRDGDGVISFPEWQRFAELYPTMLDSLYYRLKSHWEIVASKNELDQLAGIAPQIQEQERAAKGAFDQCQLDADESDRRVEEMDRAVADAQHRQRLAEEGAREMSRDVERAEQRRQECDRHMAGERERERQAVLASQHSARDLDNAQRKLAQVHSAISEAEAAERRAAQMLADAQRELQRLRGVADQANADVAMAADKHNKLVNDVPTRALEELNARMAQAEADLAASAAKEQEMLAAAQAQAQQTRDLQRAQEEAVGNAALIRERQEPARQRWIQVQRQLEDHQRDLASKEGGLAQEISQKRLLHSQEKNLVEEEVRLREQRESLEEKEGALRHAHTSFFKPSKSIQRHHSTF
eukprot:TRINITY_DN10615_c0_g1_i2.p1 TRINITY_DN10615_c0_g1~~TRINITY_DN10615_c0_g1_i2.p1  ORF type:complete len:595 (+),score=163.12 TRINITY_DN10615_c0_g1_i2:69-1787(+)